MARGWESKSVEAQQEELSRDGRGKKHRPPSEEERIRLERRATLELARSRTTADLARAAAPALQDTLRRALAALETELKSLEN